MPKLYIDYSHDITTILEPKRGLSIIIVLGVECGTYNVMSGFGESSPAKFHDGQMAVQYSIYQYLEHLNVESHATEVVEVGDKTGFMSGMRSIQPIGARTQADKKRDLAALEKWRKDAVLW